MRHKEACWRRHPEGIARWSPAAAASLAPSSSTPSFPCVPLAVSRRQPVSLWRLEQLFSGPAGRFVHRRTKNDGLTDRHTNVHTLDPFCGQAKREREQERVKERKRCRAALGRRLPLRLRRCRQEAHARACLKLRARSIVAGEATVATAAEAATYSALEKASERAGGRAKPTA